MRRRSPGFFAHWNKNRNAAAAFDRWFLNLFPRPDGKPFVVNEGGYATLNFVPSIATMIFGVLAGELLRSSRTAADKLKIAASSPARSAWRRAPHSTWPSARS